MKWMEDEKFKKFVKETEIFIITGPTLFGWIWGIIQYPSASRKFIISVQSSIISMIFLSLHGFFYALFIFFEFPSDSTLFYFFSVINSAYLILSLVQYYFFRRDEKAPGMPLTQSFLDRLFGFTKQSD